MGSEARIGGALWGGVVGDALGVPVEFRPRSEREGDPVTDLRAFGTHGQPAGTWSDDTSLTACTVESLLATDGPDVADAARRFVDWAHRGHWTPHGEVFDIGIATSGALARIAAGCPPHEAGGAGERDNGNGALMRIVPLALHGWRDGDAEVAARADAFGAVTHRHPRSRAVCVWWCLMVKRICARPLAEGPAALAGAILGAWGAFDRIAAPELAAEAASIDVLRSPDAVTALAPESVRGSGYVVDCAIASLWAAATARTFEDAVLRAVNLGDDTDTTGAVAGTLAGCLYGIDAIPNRWVKPLARRQELADLFARAAGTWAG